MVHPLGLWQILQLNLKSFPCGCSTFWIKKKKMPQNNTNDRIRIWILLVYIWCKIFLLPFVVYGNWHREHQCAFRRAWMPPCCDQIRKLSSFPCHDSQYNFWYHLWQTARNGYPDGNSGSFGIILKTFAGLYRSDQVWNDMPCTPAFYEHLSDWTESLNGQMRRRTIGFHYGKPGNLIQGSISSGYNPNEYPGGNLHTSGQYLWNSIFPAFCDSQDRELLHGIPLMGMVPHYAVKPWRWSYWIP